MRTYNFVKSQCDKQMYAQGFFFLPQDRMLMVASLCAYATYSFWLACVLVINPQSPLSGQIETGVEYSRNTPAESLPTRVAGSEVDFKR